MDKRGQIYILVALILALVLYMLMTKTNIIYEHEIIDDFETLSKNYDIEASKFMNTLLGSTTEKDVKNDFDDFTKKFTDYAKNQNPDFSLIYIFDYEDKLYIGNYLKYPIIVEDEYVLMGCKEGAVTIVSTAVGGVEVPVDIKGCILSMPTQSTLQVTIGSNSYKIDISEGRPEIVIVSREDKGEQRKVYTKEEFVGGGEEAVSGSEMCSSKESVRTNYPSFCSGKDRTFDCKIYSNFKEACEFDKECCWNEDKKECVQGACEK